MAFGENRDVYILLKFPLHSLDEEERVILMKSLLFAKLSLYSMVSGVCVHQGLSSDPAHLIINTSLKGMVN